MKMKRCHVIICSSFSEEKHIHFIAILFEMANGEVLTWKNPSREVAEMMLYHPKTSTTYQPCNE